MSYSMDFESQHLQSAVTVTFTYFPTICAFPVCCSEEIPLGAKPVNCPLPFAVYLFLQKKCLLENVAK